MSFPKKKIKPFPGLQLDFDGALGTIRTVSGGRVVVDFNHPLAGRDVVYELKVRRMLSDDREKLKVLLMLIFHKDAQFELKDHVATIVVELQEQHRELVTKKILQLIPSIKDVSFAAKKEQLEQPEAKHSPAADGKKKLVKKSRK